MVVYRVGTNTYAIQQIGYGGTGPISNTANVILAHGFFGYPHHEPALRYARVLPTVNGEFRFLYRTTEGNKAEAGPQTHEAEAVMIGAAAAALAAAMVYAGATSIIGTASMSLSGGLILLGAMAVAGAAVMQVAAAMIRGGAVSMLGSGFVESSGTVVAGSGGGGALGGRLKRMRSRRLT